MTHPVDIGPFQNIVNVSWGGKTRVLAIILDTFVFAQGEGGPPTVNFNFQIAIGDTDGEIQRHKLILPRAGAVGPPPAISQIVSPAMLAYYAIWAYDPYEVTEEDSHESGGGYYFITPLDTGVFPDFVPSPYGSVEAAQEYLDEQAIIHPEYVGKHFQIDFFPPFDTYSLGKRWRQITFINLAAFPKDIAGNVNISFTGEITPASGSNTSAQLFAGLYRGNLLDFLATPENIDVFGQPPDASYAFDATEDDTIEGTIVVHPENPPSVTGPDIGGGGGVG